ncbi:MAG: NAD(P)-binding protein, partial [Actinocatenispora sp.]
MTHVAVVGAGISGLAAALRLRELGGPAVRITLIDQSTRVGGKLSTGEVAGVPVEQGAEAFLLRDPVLAELARSVGPGGVVHPAPVGAGLVSSGRIRPLPRGTLMGIPAD